MNGNAVLVRRRTSRRMLSLSDIGLFLILVFLLGILATAVHITFFIIVIIITTFIIPFFINLFIILIIHHIFIITFCISCVFISITTDIQFIIILFVNSIIFTTAIQIYIFTILIITTGNLLIAASHINTNISLADQTTTYILHDCRPSHYR